MHLHAVITAKLVDADESARALRAEARALLIDAVADAHQLGLTQRQISEHLGRSQPEVSRLLGLSTPRFRPRTTLGRRLVERREAILLAAQELGASEVRVFGSVLRGDDHPESDYDLLIDLPDELSLRKRATLNARLEEILGRRVDVVTERGLKPQMKSRVLSEALKL